MNIPPPDEPIETAKPRDHEPYEEEEHEEYEGYEGYEGYEEYEVEYVDRRYHKLYPPAVLSLTFGVLSFLTVLNWFFGLLPLAGIVLGLLAIRHIKRSSEELLGWRLAVIGVGLSIFLGTTGSIGLVIRERYLVPQGYTLVTFAELQADSSNPIPARATELEGKRIFIRGYQYPGRQVFNIKEFVMVPSASHCKFCLLDIVPTQMLRVELVGDLTADYKTSISSVGGVLKVDSTVVLGKSPYQIEADVFR